MFYLFYIFFSLLVTDAKTCHSPSIPYVISLNELQNNGVTVEVNSLMGKEFRPYYYGQVFPKLDEHLNKAKILFQDLPNPLVIRFSKKKCESTNGLFACRGGTLSNSDFDYITYLESKFTEESVHGMFIIHRARLFFYKNSQVYEQTYEFPDGACR